VTELGHPGEQASPEGVTRTGTMAGSRAWPGSAMDYFGGFHVGQPTLQAGRNTYARRPSFYHTSARYWHEICELREHASLTVL